MGKHSAANRERHVGASVDVHDVDGGAFLFGDAPVVGETGTFDTFDTFDARAPTPTVFRLNAVPFMMRFIAMSRGLVGILIAVTMLPLVASCGGACPPIQRDNVYSLDELPDAAMSSNAAPDAMATAAATEAGDGSDGGTTADGAASSVPTHVSCGHLAEGCTAGAACPAACDCVLARERTGLTPMLIVDQCTFVGGPGSPSVEVKSHIKVSCL